MKYISVLVADKKKHPRKNHFKLHYQVVGLYTSYMIEWCI